jgi:hypothetical protein
LFGESDQASGKEVFEQHTAITLSWPEVKLLSYFIQIQVLACEGRLGGPIPLHPISVPPPFPEKMREEAEADPRAKETLEHMEGLREKLIADLNSRT